MSWLVFSSSLPKSNSSSRVALWRRLKRVGAVSPKSGVHILPCTDECLEAFQWLAQEVQQANGEVLVMRVERFEGFSDEQVIEVFHAAVREDYTELLGQTNELEKNIKSQPTTEEQSAIIDSLEKLNKRFLEIKRIDFFHSPDATPVTDGLERIKSMLLGKESKVEVAPVSIADYQEMQWVTRLKPHVDRLACIWLIRRFIDPKANIRYSQTPEADEISFDMPNATFGHHGNLCSFETMMHAFQLDAPGLKEVAEVVHEIDLRDGRYLRPETEGVATVLKGWQLAKFDNQQLESNGLIFFDGLYASFK